MVKMGSRHKKGETNTMRIEELEQRLFRVEQELEDRVFREAQLIRAIAQLRREVSMHINNLDHPHEV